MNVRIILVEPKSEENIGAVARVAKNFGFSNLYLVNPRELGIKAFTVASHAHDVLESSTIVHSLKDALANAALVIGTTSKLGTSVNKHLRIPSFSPRELKKKIEGNRGLVSIVFGREDIGLLNDELMLCDIVVYIPTSPGYPVLNLSHAVAVLLYELSDVTTTPGAVDLASKEDRERLLQHLKTFLDEIEYRDYKKEKTMLMLRRILGRAELTAREVRTLRGVISKAERKIGEGIRK
jgi:tRNA/rRNA methyltransferase